MPLEIKQFLQKYLPGAALLPPLPELQVRPVGGGSINAAYQLTTKQNSQWFIKFNRTAGFPDLFTRESQGLALLREQGVAALHRQTTNLFGLAGEGNNWLGTLPQDNTPGEDWVSFFIHRRLEPQISLAAANGLLDAGTIRQLRHL